MAKMPWLFVSEWAFRRECAYLQVTIYTAVLGHAWLMGRPVPGWVVPVPVLAIWLLYWLAECKREGLLWWRKHET